MERNGVIETRRTAWNRNRNRALRIMMEMEQADGDRKTSRLLGKSEDGILQLHQETPFG
jgi:hypothetical protein